MKPDKLKRWLTVMGALMLSGAALGGNKSAFRVLFIGNTAIGNLGYLHNNSEPLEKAGCWSEAGFGVCFATAMEGTEHVCTTSDPALLRAIRAVRPDSYLAFGWDTLGHCVRIVTQISSQNEPKL